MLLLRFAVWQLASSAVCCFDAAAVEFGALCITEVSYLSVYPLLLKPNMLSSVSTRATTAAIAARSKVTQTTLRAMGTAKSFVSLLLRLSVCSVWNVVVDVCQHRL